jgi:6-pyruvoyltetrahydropterin/6-carboxytetrahydropterin synthase
MSNIRISKTLEFDAGHRLPNHNSKCKNLHGHHYKIEITLEGPVNTEDNQSQQGMLIDFTDIKKITQKTIIEPWDHAFFVYKNDHKVLNFLESLPDHKTVITELPPTAEHLTQMAYDRIKMALKKHSNTNVKIVSLKLFETPTSWAEVNESYS